MVITISCNNKDKNTSIKKIQKTNSIKNQYKADENSIVKYPSSGIKYDHLTFSFKFYFDKAGYILNKIEVCSKDKIYQTISANKTIEEKKIWFKDWNFDGYKDVTILNNQGSGRTVYWIWNYKPETKQFIYNKDLSDVLGLEMDSISQSIIFHYRGGWQEEFWDTLKYKKTKLVFVKGMYQQQWNDAKGNQWRKRTYKRIINHRSLTKVDSCIVKP